MTHKLYSLIATTLIACLVWGPFAQACQGPQFERHILLNAMPNDVKDGDFAGKVELKEKRPWLLRLPADKHGYSVRVIESETHPELIGTYMELPLLVVTSCGPFLTPTQSGYMTGRFDADSFGGPSIFPRSYSGMAVLFPPAASE